MVKRKYSIDESFLDNVDTEHKAYFLGFFYADGYNGGQDLKCKVAIALHRKDVHILEAFRGLLQSEHPIRTESRRNGDTVCFEFCSKRLSQRLTELGCNRAKTFTITFPEWLDPILIPHFIRGFVDGDGWIHFKGKGVTIGALGADAFTFRLGQFIHQTLGVHITYQSHPKSKGITNWQVRGRDQVSTVLAWLYKDATIYLHRKKEKAEAVLTPVYYKSKPSGSNCHLSTLVETQVLQIKQMMLSGFTTSSICRKLGVNKDQVNDIRIGRTWHHITGWNKHNNLGEGQAKGQSHGMAKLTEDDVLLIKQLIEEGELNIDIAARFKISRDLISKIRCGRNWTHVTGFVSRNIVSQ